MARMPRMARTPRMARWLADYPDPEETTSSVAKRQLFSQATPNGAQNKDASAASQT